MPPNLRYRSGSVDRAKCSLLIRGVSRLDALEILTPANKDKGLMIGTTYGKVEIVEYASAWTEAFKTEKTVLLNALGDEVIEIEHVGSTAIAKMVAKPTIDMMLGLKVLNPVEHYLHTLQEIGYQFRPSHPVPGRLHFAKIGQTLRTHNLSLTKYGSLFWKEHLLFRDYLQCNSEAAEAYRELKLRLAEAYPDDTIRYTEGKNEFIEQVLRDAKKVMDL